MLVIDNDLHFDDRDMSCLECLDGEVHDELNEHDKHCCHNTDHNKTTADSHTDCSCCPNACSGGETVHDVTAIHDDAGAQEAYTCDDL